MNWQLTTLIIGLALTTSAAIGVFVANFRNKFSAAQVSNYEKSIASYQIVINGLETKNTFLEHEIKELRAMHTDNVKQIGELKGQLSMYSKLPLREIAENQKIITQVQLAIATHLGIDGFDEILDKLQEAHKNI